MAHRHKPRRMKAERMLVTTENVVRAPRSVFAGDDRANLVPGMSEEEKSAVVSIVTSRHGTAREQTEKIAAKMDKWEKQYNGEWQSPEIDDEKIFLPKTREQVQVIYAYIMLLVSQLDPLVTMRPQVSSIWASKERRGSPLPAVHRPGSPRFARCALGDRAVLPAALRSPETHRRQALVRARRSVRQGDAQHRADRRGQPAAVLWRQLQQPVLCGRR